MSPGSAVVGVVVAVASMALLFSAYSPLALQITDAAAGLGHVEQAVTRFDRIASVNPSDEMRQAALWRSAVHLEIDLRDPSAARLRYRRLSMIDGADRRADAYAEVGRLLRDAERRPVEAAEAFVDAWRVSPSHHHASKWVHDAARSYADIGEYAESEHLWTVLGRDFPEHRVTSLLARADLRLAQDDSTTALRLYRQAQQRAEGDDAAVAGLGAATCLERLGSLDEALAELDAADLPDEVRAARSGGMRARVETEAE